jgi:hypothetical protein
MAAPGQLAGCQTAMMITAAMETAITGQLPAGHMVRRPMARDPGVGGPVMGRSEVSSVPARVVNRGVMGCSVVGGLALDRVMLCGGSLRGMNFRGQYRQGRQQGQNGKSAHENTDELKNLYLRPNPHCPHSLLYDESRREFDSDFGKLGVLPRWIRGDENKGGAALADCER